MNDAAPAITLAICSYNGAKRLPACLDAVAALLHARADASMGTAAHAMESAADFANPNVVKAAVGFAPGQRVARAQQAETREGGDRVGQ